MSEYARLVLGFRRCKHSCEPSTSARVIRRDGQQMKTRKGENKETLSGTEQPNDNRITGFVEIWGTKRVQLLLSLTTKSNHTTGGKMTGLLLGANASLQAVSLASTSLHLVCEAEYSSETEIEL